MFLKKVNPWVFNSIFASCCTLRLIGIETHPSVCNSSRVQVVLFQNLNKLCQLQTATKQQTDDHTSLPVTTDVCYDCTTNKRKSTKIQKKKTIPPLESVTTGSPSLFWSSAYSLALSYPHLTPKAPACHQRFNPLSPARSMSAAALLKAAWAKRMKYARFSTCLMRWEDIEGGGGRDGGYVNMLRIEIFCKKCTFLMNLWPVL